VGRWGGGRGVGGLYLNGVGGMAANMQGNVRMW